MIHERLRHPPGPEPAHQLTPDVLDLRNAPSVPAGPHGAGQKRRRVTGRTPGEQMTATPTPADHRSATRVVFPEPRRVELEEVIVDLRELGPHEVVVQARLRDTYPIKTAWRDPAGPAGGRTTSPDAAYSSKIAPISAPCPA